MPEQLFLSELQPESPEALVHEHLARAMIRYRGDIQAYYKKLLGSIPDHPEDTKIEELRAYVAQRFQRAR